MKIIITGKDSYIGNHIQQFIVDKAPDIEVQQLDVIGDAWKSYDFTGCDTVIHVAAIVHRKDVSDWNLYRSVNTELPISIAEQAKKCGVKQFVFLSTMAVYGVNKTLSRRKSVIRKGTVPAPNSMYGKSKYLAEVGLQKLATDGFHVAIIRPPNVYGPQCRGGYITTYERIVRSFPVIPSAYTSVKQSVLFIDNLCSLVFQLSRSGAGGIYMPQDFEPICAADLMKAIADAIHLKRSRSSILGLLVYPLCFLLIIRKGYGGVCYDSELSSFQGINYLGVSTEEGVRRTVCCES